MKISDEVIKIFDEFGKRFGIIIDWSNENVIPYLTELFQKFINYEISTSIFLLSVGVVFLIIGIFFCFKYKSWDEFEELQMISIFIIITCIGVGILMIGFQIHDIITCKTFPELIIFEEIKHYMP